MTYCVGLLLEQGFVMMSDSRTNGGVDNLSTYSKLAVVEAPGERVIALMGSGNLAVSQTVVNRLTSGEGAPEGTQPQTLSTVSTMLEAARLVGDCVREAYARDGAALLAQNYFFDLNFLLAGQVGGERMRLFQIYSAGNFMESTPDAPFVQIGEYRYGKQILDRMARHDMMLEDATKLACLAMDATLRSNLSVGLPADLIAYRRDHLRVAQRRRITADDPYFAELRDGWSEAFAAAYRGLPTPPWPLA